MLYNQNIIKNKPREKEQISFNNPLGNVGGGFVKNQGLVIKDKVDHLAGNK